MPRYATRSELAAILADSVLVERCGEYYCDVEIDDFENSIVGNRKKATRQPAATSSSSSSSAFSATSASTGASTGDGAGARQAPRRTVSRNRPRPPPMDAYFFEKDLLKQAQQGAQNAFRAVINGVAALDGMLEARATLWGALRRVMVFGTKALQTLAVWAGGDLLPPNQVLSSLSDCPRRLSNLPPLHPSTPLPPSYRSFLQ